MHDRDPLFTVEFIGMLADVGVKSAPSVSSSKVIVPPRRLNAQTKTAAAIVSTLRTTCRSLGIILDVWWS
jgi:hypothetical protein